MGHKAKKYFIKIAVSSYYLDQESLNSVIQVWSRMKKSRISGLGIGIVSKKSRILWYRYRYRIKSIASSVPVSVSVSKVSLFSVPLQVYH